MFISYFSSVPLICIIIQFIILFNLIKAKNLLKEEKNYFLEKNHLKILNDKVRIVEQRLPSVRRSPYDEVFVYSNIFRMAAAAYGTVSNFASCLQTITGSYSVYFDIQVPCFTNENCTGFLAYSLATKSIILSFGTSKNAYKQLLNNTVESIFYKRRKSPLGYGSGLVSDALFSIYYQMQLNGIIEKTHDLLKFFDGYELWITGHSIGGAIASFAAAKIASDNVIEANLVKFVTFGQPRVGNKAWAAAIENSLPYYTYRVVNERDIIANLPNHSFLYYTHFRMEILYFASNSSIANSSSLENYKVCTSGEDKHCRNSDNIFNINDHTDYYGINVAEFGLNGCSE